MLIINAKILTMTGQDFENGFIRIADGKIAEVGAMRDGLIDEQVIDAASALVLPGFIDAHTHLGMFEDSLGFEGDDGNEDSEPSTPHLRAIDAINPMDKCFDEALRAGVTTVVTGPGSANAIGGQMLAMKTYGECVDLMTVKAPVAIKMALGENPKTVYNGKGESPKTRMATASIIRTQLIKTKKYLADLERSRTDEDFDEPEYDEKCEALIPLFTQGLSVHFHAHRADDIFTAMRIADEFKINYLIVHATQGHKIAKYLADKKVGVLSGPLLCDRSKPELSDLTPESVGILDKAGVPCAIITDHPVIPIQYLPLCAALAVREGMDYNSALEAITINAAKLCGIADRVGSIEVGKDADVVMFDGDPLSVYAKPKAVVINGKRVF
ncbi:MAG: amidohydrolase [Clostridia bacterium]|nr:amidohydrolase [Clostridia bacterium]